MIGPEDSDAAVLALLRGDGPGMITVKQLAARAGMPRVTARTSVAALAIEGLICLIANDDESAYQIRHLHAGPGRCEHSLACVIQEAG